MKMCFDLHFGRAQPRVARSPTLGQSIMEEAIHLMGERGVGIREQEEGWGPGIIFKDPCPVTTKVSRTSPNRTTDWGPSIQHSSLWGAFPVQSVTGWLRKWE